MHRRLTTPEKSIKWKQASRTNLSSLMGGRNEFERTKEFMNKVEEIRKDVTGKYSPTLSNERNWLRRLLIKVKLEIEIRKRIQALSSLKIFMPLTTNTINE